MNQFHLKWVNFVQLHSGSNLFEDKYKTFELCEFIFKSFEHFLNIATTQPSGLANTR